MFGKKDNRSLLGRQGDGAIPLLPLRDIIIFPGMVVPLYVGRERSINALERASGSDKRIFLTAQKKARIQDPAEEDIFHVGTLSQVIQLLRLPDGNVKVLVEGKARARIKRFIREGDVYRVEVEELPEKGEPTVQTEALVRSVKSAFEAYARLNRRIPNEMLAQAASITDPGRLADTLVAHLNLKLVHKQQILEALDTTERLEKLHPFIQSEIEILEVEKKIRSRVKKQMDRNSKEMYLNEQMQAIQRELGEKDEFRSELDELENKLRQKKLPVEVRKRARKEFKKLKMMSPMSAEATVVRTYIDWVMSLPWNDASAEKLDIAEARKVLDDDHYGLKTIKERILEYLAVRSLVESMKGPILCFVGPPGVGKTSLARSIARATGRTFVRLSLGGVRDEAEIRGHRRTYIGAMPGKIIQSMKKAGKANPVFLLDEVDKMGMDFRGDPAAALLEVLDPEQNSTFNDHYLDLDYDLSQVMFIATANSLQGIPLPLQDRLEIITLAGYTEEEKLSIARKYLISKQREANGLKEGQIQFTAQAVTTLIRSYTREAGVRNLEREVAAICRKVARRIVEKGSQDPELITEARVRKLLGVPRYVHNELEEKDEIGFANGLAYTSVGGEVVPIEASLMPGRGKLILTGQLGTVFQESAHAALSYIRARSSVFGLDSDFYQKLDIHIHVPVWGVDGPSAGITICLAMVSALLQVPVRKDISMTGQISLRGRVLPIGGVKEKFLAAHRGGSRHVLLPRDNEKDLENVPSRIRKSLTITLVGHMDEVLRTALRLDNAEEFFQKLAQVRPLERDPGTPLDDDAAEEPAEETSPRPAGAQPGEGEPASGGRVTPFSLDPS